MLRKIALFLLSLVLVVTMMPIGSLVVNAEEVQQDVVASSDIKVVFSSNGTTSSDVVQSAKASEPFFLNKNSFTRNGYEFLGWSTSKSSVKPMYLDEAEVTFANSITLYAVWKKIENCKIMFDANGGIGEMADQIAASGESVTLNKCAFIRKGYIFKGWALSPKGDAKYSNSGRINVSADTVLYAVWKGTEYTISYNGNGATSGSMANQSLLHGNYYHLVNNLFKKTGHTFKGWSLTKGGSVVYKDKANVLDVTDANYVDLYAVWQPKSYKVTFKKAGGKGSMSAVTYTYGKAKKLTANKFKKKGYVFKGWAKKKGGKVVYKNKQKIKVSKNLTLYAVWKKK